MSKTGAWVIAEQERAALDATPDDSTDSYHLEVALRALRRIADGLHSAAGAIGVARAALHTIESRKES